MSAGILTPWAHRRMVLAITVVGRQPSRREIRQAYRRYLRRLITLACDTITKASQ